MQKNTVLSYRHETKYIRFLNFLKRFWKKWKLSVLCSWMKIMTNNRLGKTYMLYLRAKITLLWNFWVTIRYVGLCYRFSVQPTSPAAPMQPHMGRLICRFSSFQQLISAAIVAKKGPKHGILCKINGFWPTFSKFVDLFFSHLAVDLVKKLLLQKNTQLSAWNEIK